MKKIGVFDSGYGGLTVLKEIRSLLPEYDYIYLGDNARAPYGSRSFDVVYQFTLQAVKKLFELDCELVILACNTASAKALRTIQQNDLPKLDKTKRVLGVIRPTAEEIGKLTYSNKVGVLGTQGTVSSGSYLIEINKHYPELEVFQKACPLWVPLIENNSHLSEGGRSIIQEDVKDLLSICADIDTMLLACTHYPLLADYLSQITHGKIQIISQGPIVAKSLQSYLGHHRNLDQNLSKAGSISYFTTEQPEAFDYKASQFLGEQIQSVHISIDTVQ
jgi:glutamate racemase